MSIFKSMNTAEIAKNKDKLFNSSFFDLEGGLVYKDVMGWRTNKPVNKLDDIWEKVNKYGLVEDFDQMQEEGYTLGQSVEEIQKNYDTGDWALPTYYVPEIQVLNPELTPAADLIARETVENETVNVTVESGQPTQDLFGSLETTDDSEGSYIYSDGSYREESYDVTGYGMASRLEDKLILAANALRSTESVAEQLHMNTIRQVEERQILKGQYSNGWDGMVDLADGDGTALSSVDTSGSIDWQTQIRELIDEVELNGGNRGDSAVFVGFETHREIRNDLQDFIRYNDVGEELGFGFETIEYDGVPILKSHALPETHSGASSGDALAIAGDMGKNYMAMLQDITVKPLAKTGPQEQFATDAYGTFVSEAPEQIQYIDKS